jgi:hypothetical protein
MEDSALLVGFEEGSLPEGAFGHREHLRAAWIFVRKYGLPDALTRFAEALKRFAAAKGAPQLYHQTITWAYLLLIEERLARHPAEKWDDFAAANSDLLDWKPSLLDRYYTPELLWSDLARRTFVMPDRVAAGPAAEQADGEAADDADQSSRR